MSKISLSSYFPGSTRCAGRYLFHERHRLARGSSANVYVALDEQEKRVVALKLLHRPRVDEPYEQFEDRLLRFRVETEVYAEVEARHPSAARYIIPTLDANTDPTAPRQYHAMALADGSLRDLLVERAALHSPLPARDVLRYASQVAQGLRAAERCGYVHRDVKPENILLMREGDECFTASVTDFGIAKVVHETTTEQGHALPIGTWGYMSPEQILRGVDRAHGRSDVWSVGVVVYELFTLYPCWLGGGAASLRQEALDGLACKGSERASRHWEQTEKLQLVDEWLARCLARRPCDRYLNPVEAVAALEERLLAASADLSKPLVCGSRAPVRNTPPAPTAAAEAVPKPEAGKATNTLTQPAADIVVSRTPGRTPLNHGTPAGRGLQAWRTQAATVGTGVVLVGALLWNRSCAATEETGVVAATRAPHSEVSRLQPKAARAAQDDRQPVMPAPSLSSGLKLESTGTPAGSTKKGLARSTKKASASSSKPKRKVPPANADGPDEVATETMTPNSSTSPPPSWPRVRELVNDRLKRAGTGAAPTGTAKRHGR